ncbi:MAG: trypsin-like peptidase domain-containing protein [Rhodobacteraceae bacterium]|nr:trypsin-like peptidase domain-containing protein [Paracoccaceae bacterium]
MIARFRHFWISGLLAAVLAAPAVAETRVPESRAEIALSFAPLVREATPAVVNIYASRVVSTPQSPFAGNPFFEDFFRDFGAARPRVENSLGSGVILSPDGILVSNYHVVGQATEIRAVLNDRREFAARVLLADRDSDLAILQLEGASDMPFLDLRDSDKVEVGELVLAIGNPFGVGQTVTSGIISGLARSGGVGSQGRSYFIQTDAPINPGNSGGALIDMTGRLIGVNTAILSRSGGSQGIGFAIPANLVAQFVKQARNGNDRFERPWAGMSGQPVEADVAEALGMAIPEGILVTDLHPSSPFTRVGVEPGDVILSVDGQPVNTPAEMIFRMSVAGIGAEARVERFRAGQIHDLVLQMVPPPEDPPRETTAIPLDLPFGGMVIANTNPALLSELGLDLRSGGVVVVDPGSAGGRAGLARGDLLQRVNGKRIERPDDVELALRLSRGSLIIEAERAGRRLIFRFSI